MTPPPPPSPLRYKKHLSPLRAKLTDRNKAGKSALTISTKLHTYLKINRYRLLMWFIEIGNCSTTRGGGEGGFHMRSTRGCATN